MTQGLQIIKKFLNFGLKLIVSSILLYIFFSQVDTDAVIKTIQQTKTSLFIIAFFICLTIVLVGTKRWSLFLPQGMKYSRLLSLCFIGTFFSAFLPGVVGGDAVKAYYIYKDTGKGGASLASVFMDRYIGLTAMLCIGFIAFIGGYAYIKRTDIIWLAHLLFSGFLLASSILWKVNWGRIRFFNSFYTPLMDYKRKKIIIYKALLLGFVVQSIGILFVYLLSKAIGLTVPIIYFFIFVPIISAISAIPLSIAGLGIREAGYVILFTRIGVTSAEALSLSLLVFVNMVIINLIGGIEYLRIGKPPRKEELGV